MSLAEAYQQALRREPIIDSIDSDDTDLEDEADFLAARRENSLAVDALDALGPSAKKQPSTSSPHTSGHQILLSLIKPEEDGTIPALEEMQPSLTSSSKSTLCLVDAVNPFTRRATGVNELKGSGMTRDHSRFFHNASVVRLQKPKAASMASRTRPTTRKAGVFECPCAPRTALLDIRAVLEDEYFAVMTGEAVHMLGVQVPVNSSHGSTIYNIVITGEDRQFGCRLLLRRNVTDLWRITNDDFDHFCSGLFHRLLLVRQVVRPYYV